jgi:hypothetical protein
MTVLMRASDKRFIGRLERLADRVSQLDEPSPSWRARILAYSDIIDARNDLSAVIGRMERDHRDLEYAAYAWELLDFAIVILARTPSQGLAYISRDVAADLLRRAVQILKDEAAPDQSISTKQ